MTDTPKRTRGRPPGSKNAEPAKISVGYRIDPRIHEALKNPGPVSATLEEWATRIELQPKHLKLLDANRGADSRSAVVQRLIEREFGGEPAATDAP